MMSKADAELQVYFAERKLNELNILFVASTYMRCHRKADVHERLKERIMSIKREIEGHLDGTNFVIHAKYTDVPVMDQYDNYVRVFQYHIVRKEGEAK